MPLRNGNRNLHSTREMEAEQEREWHREAETGKMARHWEEEEGQETMALENGNRAGGSMELKVEAEQEMT